MRDHARAAGLAGRVTFSHGDFHRLGLAPGRFDLVLMVMSLHHALDLAAVLDGVERVLRPGGTLVVNEYIGPDRWQFGWVQLLLIKAWLTLLPRRLRRDVHGGVKGRIGRPTLEWMLRVDPSEAAHSSAIPGELGRRFDVLERVDYGGGVSIPVLDGIIGNFREGDSRALGWLGAVLRSERWAMASGLVPSNNAVIVCRSRRGVGQGRNRLPALESA